ncbi:bone marrow stromal antigen 2 isoform X1 [Mirounga angustirostris]|uniref:bone marrow stromal antigen 2 isoform X1 n=1 Tax=Mirounga leonina TaxID=9715 RepID=UPI00156C2FD7|nr:bone marrow stromal antigen 2 isoform X1 [Mirounga leonina]XP_054360825.1 bone marrow stromal antigen 2 isoform X1 [Mirounga angustirostris]
MAPTFYHYWPVPTDKSESMLQDRLGRQNWPVILGIPLVLGLFIGLIVFAVRANSKACKDGLLAEQECRNVTRLLELQLTQTRQDLLGTMDQAATCNQIVVNLSASLEMEKAQGQEEHIQKEELRGEIEKLKQKLQDALEEVERLRSWCPLFSENRPPQGTWVPPWVKRLPSAQVTIPGSWDRAPHQAPCSAGSLLLPLPAIPPICALSL